MSKATNTTRTANDTATREEQTAVTTATAEAVSTFVANAGTSNVLTFTEATVYVAAVDAHGKRGGAAAVQRAIADGLRTAGYEPLSQSRYSKLADAYRALASVGIATDAEGFRVTYGLFNMSSALLTAADRDAVLAKAARMRNADKRLPFLTAELEAARAGNRKPVKVEEPPADEKVDETVDEIVETVDVPSDVEGILDAIAELYAAASALTDAERIRVADALRVSADSLAETIVPSDVSTLTDAA